VGRGSLTGIVKYGIFPVALPYDAIAADTGLTGRLDFRASLNILLC
jgi:hypothetical protein